jgi:exosortase D (VPLPA-CTERM-specific)
MPVHQKDETALTAANRTKPTWLQGLLYILFFLALLQLSLFYAGTAHGLWRAWQTDDFSHGPLVVVMSFLWGLSLLQAEQRPLAPSARGSWLVASGILVALLGQRIANAWLAEISLPIVVAGLVATVLGFRQLKRLAAPLFFLLFAIPLPVTLYPVVTAHMQLLASDLGVKGLQALNVPVFQDGNIIDLGLYKLQVAEACNGLRYLFPLMSLGFLVAFHLFRTPWRRALLFLSTLPIAIVTNGVRLTATGLLANQFGLDAVQGTLHEMEGFFVFAVCLALLALVAFLLARLGPPEPRPADNKKRILFSFKKPLWQGHPRFSTATVLGLVLAALLAFAGQEALATRETLSGAPPHKPLSFFPLGLEAWQGQRQLLSNEELRSLKLDDYLLMDFRQEGQGIPVNLYVAYYESQGQGRSIHSPQICLPGTGWEILSKDLHKIQRTAAPEALTVNREVIRKDGVVHLVYYWFRESGSDVHSNVQAKWEIIKNAVRTGRTDGNLIRVTTVLTEGMSGKERASQKLDAFLDQTLPTLSLYLSPATAKP